MVELGVICADEQDSSGLGPTMRDLVKNRSEGQLHTPRQVQIEFNPRAFRRVELASTFGYWQSKLNGRSMPSRADIVPAELTMLLPQILLVDVLNDADDFRYRLLGTRLTHYFPERATGKTFSEALASFGEETVTGTIGVYRQIVTNKLPALISGPGEYYNQAAKSFQAVLTPLSDDDCMVNMIFGAFEFELNKGAELGRTFSPEN